MASVASVDVWSGNTRSRGSRTGGRKSPDLSEDGGTHHILYSSLDGPRRKGRMSPGLRDFGALCRIMVPTTSIQANGRVQ